MLTDAMGNSWDLAFTAPVTPTAAKLTVGTVELSKDQNGDGKLSPGESGEIRVFARNVGTSGALGVRASVTAVPTGAVITSCSAGGMLACGASCQCDATGYGQTVTPGDSPSVPVLVIDFDVA